MSYIVILTSFQTICTSINCDLQCNWGAVFNAGVSDYVLDVLSDSFFHSRCFSYVDRRHLNVQDTEVDEWLHNLRLIRIKSVMIWKLKEIQVDNLI